MEQFKHFFIVTILCCFVTTAFSQQYTPMTAAGYQMKRIKADSTLHIPSFCGSPNINKSTAKQGALAMDTCNNKLYKWTNQAGWSEVSGGAGGGGTVTSVGTGYGLTGGPVTTTGTISVDSVTISAKYLLRNDTSNLVATKSNVALKVNISDTSAMLSNYLHIIDTTNKWVNSITRTSGKDSIIYYIGSNRYAIKDSVGSFTQSGRFGNDTATIIMAKVHNDAGVTLTNGKVVYLGTSGTNSDAPSVRLANNKGDSSSANTFGFVSGTINVNDTGWVILSGKIEKLNTSAFSNGDVVYLDSISGNWTKTKPVAPYHMVYLGVVIKANAGNGSIFVKCQNGYEISEIHDIQISGIVNNNILVYSDTQKVWKNRSIYSVVDTVNTIATKSNVALKSNLSQGTYSFLANNTNTTANMTNQPFVDKGSQTYSSTITWNTTGIPSGTTNHSYRWTQVGKLVTLQIMLVYGTASTVAQTTVQMALPSDMPTPITPSGLTATNLDILYFGIGNFYATSTTTSVAQPFACYLRGTAAGGYEVIVTRGASVNSLRYVNATVQYFTNTTY